MEITVTDVNEAPAFADDAPTAQSVAENTAPATNIGTSPYTATDPDDGATMAYSLDGTDAASFDIDAGTGQLKTKAELDHETKSSYSVTVKVSDGSLSDTVDVAITVTDVDEPPGKPAAPTVQATSPTELSVSWQAPANTGRPAISDYDYRYKPPTDTNWTEVTDTSITLTTTTISGLAGNTAYEVQVRANNDEGAGEWSDSTTQTTVVQPNRAPSFASDAPTAQDVDENTAADASIGDPYTATDPDTGDTLTYSLEGTDAASFGIDTTGQLKTNAPLNHETKSSYSITIKVSDGTLSDTVNVTINVTDVAEKPGAPAAPTLDSSTQTSLTVSWSAPTTNTGPAISDYDVQYRPGTSGSWTDLTHDGTATSATVPGLAANTQYQVRVRAYNDEQESDWSSPLTSTTQVQPNAAPTFTDGTSATRSVAENTATGQNVGAPVAATDTNAGDTLTYTLEGADASSFAIVPTSGQLQTSADLDYETDSSYSVTVKVTDGQGESDTVDVTITVTDVNEAPSFDTAPTTHSVAENTAAPANLGTPYTATDPDDGDTVTFSLEGTDAGSFAIDPSSGQLKTKSPLDHETKASHSITVKVSDGSLSDTVNVTITVTDVNEAPAFAETAPATQSVDENTPMATNIGTSPYTATDPDSDTLTYSLEGTDAASFDIDSSGQLKTKAALNHEAKSSYSITIKVSDGTLSDTVDVTITVTNVAEPPGKPSAPTVAATSQTELSVSWSAPSNTGPAISDYDYRYQEQGAANWTEVTDTSITATTITIDNLTANTAYEVQVRASNDEGAGDWSDSTTQTTLVQPNRAPEFPSNAPITQNVAENTAADTDIGTSPYTATDLDADSLTYTLEGTDAGTFDIDSHGQLKTKEDLDYETKDSYSITVKVDDGRGGSDTVNVTITVTDVNEAPAFDTAPATQSVDENTATATNFGSPYTATDQDAGDTPTFSLEGTDAASFDIDSGTGQLKTKAPLDHETKDSYSITVKASDGSLSDTVDVTITVTDVNEAPAFATGAPTTQSVDENTAADTTIGNPYTATDPDAGGTLTYSLEGTDAASFAIDSTGQLKSQAELNHETTSTYTITVKVSDGSLTDTVDVTITVTDVSEKPGAPAAPTLDSSTQASLTVSWSAPTTNTGPAISDYDVQYRQGTSGSWTDVPHEGTGASATIPGLTANTQYQVQVRAYNDEQESDWSSPLTSTTQAQPNRDPSFATGAPTAQSVAEDAAPGTNIGSPYTATDPDAGGTLTYSLEGTDAASFAIDSTGQLKTEAALNHEAKSSYSITVKVSDGSLTDTVDVAITVTDVSEKPGAPAALTLDSSTQTSLTVSWSAPTTNTGPAISDYDVQYRPGTSGSWTDVPHDGTGTSATIPGLAANTQYQVQVRAYNDEQESDWSPPLTTTTLAQPNRAPAFPGNSRTAHRVAENTPAGANIGDPYTAADPDAGDTLTYSLEGADASSFIIDSIGQLRTSAALNYEAKTSYSVTVKVSDGRGGSDTVTVTISVTDVNEPPGKPAAPTLARDESKTDLAVSWEAPENTGPAISGYDYRHRQQDAAAEWTTRNTANTSATITGLLEGQTYEVQVRASNAEGAGDWSDSATWSFNVPGAPENLHAFVTRVGGTDTLVVRFDPPGNEGGSDIIRYELDESYDEGVTWEGEQTELLVVIAPREGGGLHIQKLPLTSARNANQARLRYRVRAVNQQGAGPWAGPAFIGGEPGQVARPPGPPEPPPDTTPPERPTIVRFDNIQDPDFDGVLNEGQHIDLLALFMNDPVTLDKTCRDSSITVLCGTPYVLITFEADRGDPAGTSGAKARAYFHPGLYADQPDTLGFRYTIAAGDDGWLRMPANGLNANGGAITDLADNAATDLSHVARSADYRVDTRGPEFKSASVEGDRVTVTFDEPIDSTFTAYSSFTVKVNSKARALSDTAYLFRVGGSTITLILAESVTAGDTVTVGYTLPSNSDPVRDRLGLPAAAFGGKSVTNDTPAEPPPGAAQLLGDLGRQQGDAELGRAAQQRRRGDHALRVPVRGLRRKPVQLDPCRRERWRRRGAHCGGYRPDQRRPL